MLHAWRTSLLTTLRWPKSSPNSSRMQANCDELTQQANEARMNVNGRKTKEMLIGTITIDPRPSLSLCGAAVNRLTECQHSSCLWSTCPTIWSGRSMLTPLCCVQSSVTSTLSQAAEASRLSDHARTCDYVSSCGIPLMPVIYQVVGFGRGNGRHSGRHGRNVV